MESAEVKTSVPQEFSEEPPLGPLMTSNEEQQKTKDLIIDFAEAYTAELAAERFGIARNTLRSWLKQRKIPTRPVYNSPGQGRKITYSRELDFQIADHVRKLVEKDEKVTVQDVCTYARKLIQTENPDFTASTGWAQRFLTRNNIDLSAQVKKLIPTTRQTHLLAGGFTPDNRGRPLSYSADTDNLIADWVRARTDRGEIITNSELRKYAKEIISKQNPNFTGSASWAQNFLLRHRLSLHPTFLSPGSAERQKPSDSSISSSQTNPTVPSLQLISSQIACEGQTQESGPGVRTSLHSITQSSSSLANESLTTSSSSYTTVDDGGVTSTLALLAGENIQVEGNLSQSQTTALTLSDLTSDPTLAEILGASQDPATANIASFSQATLDTPVTQLSYLNSLSHQLSDLVVPSNAASLSSSSLNVAPPQNNTTVQSVSGHSDVEAIGSGTRPLSYAKETDQALANWVKQQQASGYKVTFASLRAYAKKLVSSENPNFNASVGWVTPFLLRHNLDLKVNDKRSRSTRKTTHPRKLQSKGEGGASEDMELSSNDDPPVMDDDGEIEIQAIMPRLSSAPFNGKQQQQRQDHNQEETLDPVAMDEGCIDQGTSTADEDGHCKVEDTTHIRPSKKMKVSNRVRHTLAEKLEVVRLMKQHNVAGHYVSKLLGIANSTLSGWIKLVDQKGSELEALSTNKKRSNRSGQGRPLTYSKDKDEIIALWLKQQQEMGVAVSAQELTAYATNVIQEENSNFIASVGWRHKFLQRHNLQLVKNDKSAPHEDLQNIPLPVQTEEVCTDEYTPATVVDKVLPDDVSLHLADWTRQRVLEHGSLSIQLFCRRAEEMILPLDSMFVATLGWAFKFLHKHGVLLDPKPVSLDANRKRPLTPSSEANTPKKSNTTPPQAAAIVAAAIGFSPEGLTVSPSTGNLCEALLSLSSQPEHMTNSSPVNSTPTLTTTCCSPIQMSSSTKTYFGKPAREFNGEEKEEVVRYANATTLQKAAIKYGVAAPTVWRWRMELKLHQPKYTANQKKYIVKFAETNSLKDAASRFGITTKTVQNWKKSLQLDGTLSDVEIAAIAPPSLQEMTNEADSLSTHPSSSNGELMSDEVIPLDNSDFQYIVDGGEVAEGSRVQQTVGNISDVSTASLEVTHEIQVHDVGMEYDVISSEGHAAKPRCTQEEKDHILQYALDHSIKEASVKYGVSPGTLYYWKKNFLSTKSGVKLVNCVPGVKLKSSSSLEEAFPTVSGTNLETTVVNVSVPVDIVGGNNSSSVMQSPTGGADSALQNFAITDAGVLTDGTVPTSSLINAITQTLASATPEQLHSLQQITSDFNLLQAVTTLLSSQEGSSSLKSVSPLDGTPSRHESSHGSGEVISSPTEVLVSFHPSSVTTANTSNTAEVTTSSSPTTTVNELQVQLEVSTEMPPVSVEEITISQTPTASDDIAMASDNNEEQKQNCESFTATTTEQSEL